MSNNLKNIGEKNVALADHYRQSCSEVGAKFNVALSTDEICALADPHDFLERRTERKA